MPMRIGISIVIGSLMLAAVSAEQQAAPAGTAVVTGRVIDATSMQPIAGAVVSMGPPPATPTPGGAPPSQPPASAIKRAVTNGDGRFVFRDIPAGTYSIGATRDGYSSGAFGRKRPGGPQRSLAVADAARLTDVTIPVFRLPTITGVVRDDRGEPAVGVYVTAMRRAITGGRAELAFSSGEATDDRGHYRIAFLEPGAYVVIAQTTSQTVPVTTVERYRTAVASGTAAQMARALREGGALQVATEGLIIDGWQVTTSSRGTLMPGPNGTLYLSPLTFYGGAGSVASATVLTLGPGDDRQGIDFTLPFVAGVRVSGTVTGLDRPAANYGVQLVPAASGSLTFPFPIAYSVTDASGGFAFLGVPPGAYTARVSRVPPTGPLFIPSAPGTGAAAGREVVTMPPAESFPAMFATAQVTVGSTHVDGVSLTFQPGATLSGRFVFEGMTTPLTAAQLQRAVISVRSIFGGDSRGSGVDARPDESGSFKTNGLSPGRYLMNAGAGIPGRQWFLSSIHVGGVDASDQAVTIGTTDFTDVVVTFTDKSQMLTGSVRAAGTSTDVDATVIAFPADHKAWMANGMTTRRLAIAPTSTAGAYQLRIGIPGDYLVVAVPSEIAPDVDPEFIARFAGAATRVTIAAGETKSQALTVSRVR
ncbi:MAG TPA: carboxypeptidase-like regulatory domain-containing protein [Vicinamibacterales bacterium]|nr:carboxypeptidase-like regulatory domain-containing protein [Vicinamibacterales bacterium]